MEYRNPTYNQFGTIDVEIDHPVFGWIPFTASPDDPDQSGRDIFATINLAEVAAFIEPEPLPPVIPDSVSARQFKLQLLFSDILDEFEAFISTQSRAVQIAYDNSGSFVRSEPMMQSGFTALGFNDAQIDAFFVAAATL